MTWNVEVTDEFIEWYQKLLDAIQEEIAAHVEILEERGPHLPYPYSSGIQDSKYSHMRELRVQVKGDPFRIFYAFDPRRTAILLIGGNKVGDDRFYQKYIPVADNLYAVYIKELTDKGLL